MTSMNEVKEKKVQGMKEMYCEEGEINQKQNEKKGIEGEVDTREEAGDDVEGDEGEEQGDGRRQKCKR